MATTSFFTDATGAPSTTPSQAPSSFYNGGGAAYLELTSADKLITALQQATVATAAAIAPMSTLGAIQGLNTANNSADPNSSIDVAAGGARDTTNMFDLMLPTGMTKTLNATWAAGVFQGGLDTGTKANSASYHIFVIRNATTGTCDVLFSRSPTNPVMPTGYVQKRRIASFTTDASGNIAQYRQFGGFFDLKGTLPLTGLFSTATIGLQTLPGVPVGVKLQVGLLIAITATSGLSYAMVRDPDMGVPAAVDNNTAIWYRTQTVESPKVQCWTNTAAQVYTGDASTFSPQMSITVCGWFDARDAYQ